jgi:hypothetical protein
MRHEKVINDEIDMYHKNIIIFFQTFGHNSARQRDKIPTLLEEFAIAQEEVKRFKIASNY